jgi:Caspase domain
MRLRAGLICVLLVAALPLSRAQAWATPGPPEQRVALVIGEADYAHWNRLPKVSEQSQQMAKTLETLGFKVYRDGALLNQNVDEMEDDFKDFIGQIPDGALVWIFYAGHGVEGFLVPVDAGANESSLYSCCVSVENDIFQRLGQRHPKATVVILNACRDPIPRVAADSDSAHPPEPPPNTYLAFSTRSGAPTAADSPYVPDLLRLMTQQGKNIEAIFASLEQDGRAPNDPITYGTIADSVYLIPPDAPVQYLDFHEAIDDTPHFPLPNQPNYVVAAPYLEKYGISVEDVTPGTVVGLFDPGIFYSGRSASGARAILMQDDAKPENQSTCNNVQSVRYTLKFSPPLREFAFSRTTLLAESRNGITHPSWEAHAFDPDGKEIPQEKFIGEELIRYIPPAPDTTGAVPAANFHMRGPYIASVTFTSSNRLDGRPFAAFCSVQISSMGLVRGPMLAMDPDGQTLQKIAW